MSDNRAFGYIYGSPENGHRFFGIKTEKAAAQVLYQILYYCLLVHELYFCCSMVCNVDTHKLYFFYCIILYSIYWNISGKTFDYITETIKGVFLPICFILIRKNGLKLN